MTINIKGKFINYGTFRSTCPECGKNRIEKNTGEVKEIVCECGYVFVRTELNKLEDGK